MRGWLKLVCPAASHLIGPFYLHCNAAGGLLAAVPQEAAERCMDELRHAGYPHAAVVAAVVGPLPPDSNVCLQFSAAS